MRQIEDLLWTANQNQRWRETEDTGKKRKAIQVQASNSIKWSTPGANIKKQKTIVFHEKN